MASVNDKGEGFNGKVKAGRRRVSAVLAGISEKASKETQETEVERVAGQDWLDLGIALRGAWVDVGRTRTEITTAVFQRIATAMALGMEEDMACWKAGVLPQAFAEFRKQNGALTEELLARFKAEFVHRCILEVLSGRKGWQGPAWILETRYPEMFARKKQVLGTTREGGATVTNVVNVLPAGVLEDIRRLAAARARGGARDFGMISRAEAPGSETKQKQEPEKEDSSV